jgi:prolyl-tRNA synthetase
VPLVVVVGRGWKDGVVELRERFGDGGSRDVPAAEVVAEVVRLSAR